MDNQVASIRKGRWEMFEKKSRWKAGTAVELPAGEMGKKSTKSCIRLLLICNLMSKADQDLLLTNSSLKLLIFLLFPHRQYFPIVNSFATYLLGTF